GMRDRTVILYTFSKKYAMTGTRLGCAVAPKAVAEAISTMNTNDESCTNHYVQWAGIAALRAPQTPVGQMLEVLRKRRPATCRLIIEPPGPSASSPGYTFYVLPDATGALAAKGMTRLADFSTEALAATAVSVCTREHFGTPQPGLDRSYIRLAYSGIDESAITTGLGRLREGIEAWGAASARVRRRPCERRVRVDVGGERGERAQE